MTDCKWMKDEICVNADCPMRADYCPVADNEDVCRFEDRTESKAMTDKERLVELLDIIIQPGEKTLGDIADYLIANNVVVQKQGEWAEINQTTTGLPWKYRCCECGCPQNYAYNYCPNCGAKMVKEE